MSKKPEGIAGWFDSIRADYDATKQSRFIRRRTGVAPQGGSADYHFREEIKYYELIEQARDMDRNDGLVGTLADRRVDNIVQQGFTLDTKTGDKGLDRELWERWDEFANDPERCDIAGELCWHEIERLVCRAESIDGDIVVLGTEEGSFQTIEAHAIQTSSREENTFLGVTRNLYGRRDQYHVRYDLNQFGQKSSSIPIDVRNADGLRQLFHVYNPKRVSVTRGVTQLAPVFSLSGMLEDINFAKLVQQQIVSCFAIFRKMAANSDELPSVAGIYGEAGSEVNPAGTRQLEGISPGMEIVGRAGEELQGFSPNVPNSEYFQQVKLILQVIGVNFGLPLCLVLMDGSETNFSGWRGAVDEARKGFVADQQNLVRRLHTPGYLWWLNREISLDNSLKKASRRDSVNIEGHKWNLPTWSYIEPVADAEGDLKQLQGALTSPRRMHAARGKDWEEISEEIIADNFYAISRAQKQAEALNKQFPNGPMLTWRDLIPLPMQAGATLAMQDPAAVKQEDEESDAPPKKPAAKGKRKPLASEFDESKITRQDDGKFGSGSGGGNSKQQQQKKAIEGSAAEIVEEYDSIVRGWAEENVEDYTDESGAVDFDSLAADALHDNLSEGHVYTHALNMLAIADPTAYQSVVSEFGEHLKDHLEDEGLWNGKAQPKTEADTEFYKQPHMAEYAASKLDQEADLFAESVLQQYGPDLSDWVEANAADYLLDGGNVDWDALADDALIDLEPDEREKPIFDLLRSSDGDAQELLKDRIDDFFRANTTQFFETEDRATGQGKTKAQAKAEAEAKSKRKPVASEFDESKVTRDDDGKFGSGGGGPSRTEKRKKAVEEAERIAQKPAEEKIERSKELQQKIKESAEQERQQVMRQHEERLKTIENNPDTDDTKEQAEQDLAGELTIINDALNEEIEQQNEAIEQFEKEIKVERKINASNDKLTQKQEKLRQVAESKKQKAREKSDKKLQPLKDKKQTLEATVANSEVSESQRQNAQEQLNEVNDKIEELTFEIEDTESDIDSDIQFELDEIDFDIEENNRQLEQMRSSMVDDIAEEILKANE
jgi:lambda family phage portal protein